MLPDLRPRGIGELLDAGAALYRSQFGRLVRYAAIIAVPVQGLLTIVFLSAQPDHFSVGVTGNAAPQYTSTNVQLGATFIVLAAQLLTPVFVVAVTTRVIANQYLDHPDANSAPLGSTGRRFFAAIGGCLLVALCETVGFAFCVIGFVVPLALFSVAIPALLLERKGVGGALGRSYALTKSHFWHVVGVVLSAILLSVLLNWALAAGLSLFAHNADTTTIVIGQGITNSIAATLTMPFFAATTVALYFDLRIRDEAFDVQMAMARPQAAW